MQHLACPGCRPGAGSELPVVTACFAMAAPASMGAAPASEFAATGSPRCCRERRPQAQDSVVRLHCNLEGGCRWTAGQRRQRPLRGSSDGAPAALFCFRSRACVREGRFHPLQGVPREGSSARDPSVIGMATMAAAADEDEPMRVGDRGGTATGNGRRSGAQAASGRAGRGHPCEAQTPGGRLGAANAQPGSRLPGEAPGIRTL